MERFHSENEEVVREVRNAVLSNKVDFSLGAYILGLLRDGDLDVTVECVVHPLEGSRRVVTMPLRKLGQYVDDSTVSRMSLVGQQSVAA